MQRLSEIDLPALAPGAPVWIVDLATAIFCFGMMALIRILLETVFPGSAPFALLYPFGLLATLLSSWRAGMLTFFGGMLGAWYFVMPPIGFEALDPVNQGRLAIVAASGALTLMLAQLFRDSAKRAAIERAAKLEERELLLRELNHRVVNNFAMVASLLQMQAARAQDPAAKTALAKALNRVMSISQAHRNLYASGGEMTRVDMANYLQDLCRALAEALFLGEIVALQCEAHPASMERDRAVAIGLVVNELVTNAAKHAFVDASGGRISVSFAQSEQGWRLTVSDDGRGLPEDYHVSRNGLGRGLVEAFARQAGGVLSVAGGSGATFVLDLKP
jgi:two-component sensor histidine kinase